MEAKALAKDAFKVVLAAHGGRQNLQNQLGSIASWKNSYSYRDEKQRRILQEEEYYRNVPNKRQKVEEKDRKADGTSSEEEKGCSRFMQLQQELRNLGF